MRPQGRYLKKFMTVLAVPVFFLAASPLFAETAIEVRNLSFTIRPVFKFLLGSESARMVDLTGLMPDNEAPLQTLEISVVTNTGKNYRVYHSLPREISSDSGAFPPAEEVKFRVSNGRNGGQSEVPSFTSLTSAEKLVFKSSKNGAADSFRIDYSVANKEIFDSGDYMGMIRLRAEEEG